MTSRTRRILLAGATGYIGRAVLNELVARGHDVLAVTRRGADIPDADVRIAPVTDRERLLGALGDASFDSVVSCIASRSGEPNDAWAIDYEANMNLLSAALACGADRFVLLSALCVQKPRLAFQHAKLAFESELRQSAIEHAIVRPTAFFKSLSGQIDRVRQGKPFLVFGSGTETACKPIGEADLATFIVDRLEDARAENGILPIGGPGDAVTPREQGEILFDLTGMPPKFRSVPPAVFSIAGNLLSAAGLVAPAARRKAELAKIGHYYATESMLLWDERRGRYDADATPSTGTDTLRQFYRRAIDEEAGDLLGEHRIFQRAWYRDE